MKILKTLVLLSILIGVQQRSYAPATYAQYMLLRYLQLNQAQNTQILSPTPKGYNAALISPALLPLQTHIDNSFQLLNHAQKAPDLTPDPTTLVSRPIITRRYSSERFTTEDASTTYTDKQLQALREMNRGSHYFGTTEKK